jgi:hypothetical protein
MHSRCNEQNEMSMHMMSCSNFSASNTRGVIVVVDKVLDPKGGIVKGSQLLRFWRLMPKGQKVLSPKQKDRTTTILKFSKTKGIN